MIRNAQNNGNHKPNNSVLKKGDISVWRIYAVIFFIMFAALLIIFRLYCLQIRAADFYNDLADNQHKYREEIMPKRGEIYLQDRGGIFPVAINRDLPTVYAVPDEIDKNQIANLSSRISQALGLEYEEIHFKLSKENDRYELIKRKLSEEEAQKISELNASGVHLADESWRYYPAGKLCSQTIGFVGYNEDRQEGIYGIEKYYEKELKGMPGILEQERDAGGRWISIGAKSLMPAKDGSNLVLTVDQVIQFKAELIIRNAVKRHGADGGRMIVIEPSSGKILAMAQEPSFDLNNYSEMDDQNVFRNSIVSDPYECGSVFKAITMAAGLDTGSVEFDSTYYDSGEVQEAGYTIKNSDFKANGEQTMTQIIEKSLNTGAIYVEQKMGNKNFLSYVKKFGFGQVSGIELPYEAAGNIKNLDNNRDIEFYTASFGQGITVTPLQLAAAYATIGNGGAYNSPEIIDRIIDADGRETKIEPKEKRKVISKKTANELALMLESNVLNGHGKQAGVPGYRIAGKTGTAQIPDKEKGGYIEGATIGSFAGFAPIDNPRFAILAIIDYPKDVEWAESTAAPIFGEMAKFMFEYYAIEPTEEFTENDMMKFNATHTYTLENGEDEQKEKDDNEKDEKKDD